MNKGCKGLIMLLVFAFGLIPGEYWKVFHHHQHFTDIHPDYVSVSEKHKDCTSHSHLYDYTGVQVFISNVRTDSVLPVPIKSENHLPHPSFLNLSLRAPPVC